MTCRCTRPHPLLFRRDDLAYTLLSKEDYPSWGYEIRRGATTIGERWNSIQPDGSFGPVDMNSFNHYAYGAVADWMHQNIGGIQVPNSVAQPQSELDQCTSPPDLESGAARRRPR